MKRIFILVSTLVIASMGLVSPASAAESSNLARVTYEGAEYLVAPSGAAALASYVELRAVHSGKCADVEYSSHADRTDIHQFTCRGTTNQHWIPVHLGGTSIWHEIRARHSIKCMDVEGPSTADRADIHQFTCRGTTNQHWAFRVVSGNVVEIVARHSGKCADVEGPSTADRANIHQFTCRRTTNQYWRVISYTET